MSHEEVKGENTATAETLEKSVVKASMPAAIRRWDQKVAHIGLPRMGKDPETHNQQFYCHGYVDAIYDMLIGQVEVVSQLNGIEAPEPVNPKKIVLLGDQ